MGGPPIFSQRSSRERRLNDVRAELYLREFAGSNPSELCRKNLIGLSVSLLTVT